jgi:hypothetical protein
MNYRNRDIKKGGFVKNNVEFSKKSNNLSKKTAWAVARDDFLTYIIVIKIMVSLKVE